MGVYPCKHCGALFVSVNMTQQAHAVGCPYANGGEGEMGDYKSRLEAELSAVKKIGLAMEPLDLATRERLAAWVAESYGSKVMAAAAAEHKAKVT